MAITCRGVRFTKRITFGSFAIDSLRKRKKIARHGLHTLSVATRYTTQEKTAAIFRRYHLFPHEMTSKKRAQKFHTDNVSVPRSGKFL